MDRLAVRRARVTISAAAVREGQGLALKAPPNGAIRLTDGRDVRLLHVWFDQGLPLCVTHEVDCKDGELRVWNIYRTRHPNGTVTEDAWTGNAGMTIVGSTENWRRYSCSPGTADHFDPQLEVLIEWETIP